MRLALLVLVAMSAAPGAQQVINRVIARVGSSVIMLSDLRAAVALGVVEGPGAEPRADNPAFEALIERHVMLSEVARFPAPEPTELAVDEVVASMKARAGPQLGTLMRDTGLDEAAVRTLARDTLRIQAYVRQRFGAAATPSTQEVRQWLRDARARASVVVTP
jgi:hypothetical protein